jgi:hypothetical protein
MYNQKTMMGAAVYSIVSAIVATLVLAVARILLGKTADVNDLLIVALIVWLVNFVI